VDNKKLINVNIKKRQLHKIKDSLPTPIDLLNKISSRKDIIQKISTETQNKAIWLNEKTKEITSNYSEIIRNHRNILSNRMQTMSNTKLNKKDMTNFYTVILFYGMSIFLFNVSLFLKLEKKLSSSFLKITKKLKKNKQANQFSIDYSKFSITVNELVKKIKDYEHSALFFKRKAEKERANKTRLLAELSHELKTPLNGIMGYAQILLMNESSLSPSQVKCINKIMESGKYLNDIIEDVLLMAKSDTEQLSFECSKVNLKEVIEDVIETLNDLSKENSIAITVDFPSDTDLFALGETKRVKQIFYNLITNGIKYNKNNGALVISCIQEEDFHVIKIRDTGIGIAEDELENIFKPFIRLGTEDIEGTGIGLTLVKEFIEAMDGEILVNSKENIGSEFILKFKRFVNQVKDE
jgi:signal transduction histidine kinase